LVCVKNGTGVTVTVTADAGDVTDVTLPTIVAVAVAESAMLPWVMSAGVTVYVPVQDVDAPIASVVEVHVTGPIGPAGAVCVSLIVSPFRLTFPVFFTVNV
jgi:hypothetical protein